METIEATPLPADTDRFVTVADALAFARDRGWTVAVRGAKKATAARVSGTGKKATIEQLLLAGAEGERYWALMRAV